MKNETEMFRKATKHFTGWCARNGLRVDQPSIDLSEVARGRKIILRNVRGELATYVFDQFLKRARPVTFYGRDFTPDGRRIH